MSSLDYRNAANKLFLAIEQSLDYQDSLDVELLEGLLTITLPSKQQIILSQQTQMQEVWLASRSAGAFHFRLTPQGWYNAQQDELKETLVRLLSEQGIKVSKHDFDGCA